MKRTQIYRCIIYWPNQENNGVHINISGAGVTQYSKHEAALIKLLEFLSSEKAQNLFADQQTLNFLQIPKLSQVRLLQAGVILSKPHEYD